MNTASPQGWVGRGISQLWLPTAQKIPKKPCLKPLINSFYLMAVQRPIRLPFLAREFDFFKGKIEAIQSSLPLSFLHWQLTASGYTLFSLVPTFSDSNAIKQQE